MKPRSLSQINKELKGIFAPQVQSLQQRQTQIPGETQAAVQQAQAAQQTAFGDITDAARRRGLGFAGIPLAEQAKYSSNVFAPEVLRANTLGQERAQSLQDAILGIQSQRQSLAQNVFQSESDRAEQIRQYNENLRLQREQFEEQKRQAELSRQAAARGSGGGGGGGLGGFSFSVPGATSAGTQADSAPKTYIGNNDFRGALAYQAGQGNKDAKIALQYAGNDRKYDGPVKSLDELMALKNLGIRGSYYIPGTSGGRGSSGGLQFLQGSNQGFRFN